MSTEPSPAETCSHNPISLSTRTFSRRRLFKFAGGAFFTLLAGYLSFRSYLRTKKYFFSGKLQGPNAKAGHLLRDGFNQTPTTTKKIKTAIVGGGIAGLSAAWWLKKNHDTDFILFEMESETGGNSRSGQNQISPYPWGAHYVPLPSPEAHYVRELFEELGVITGYEKGLPVYNEFYLCADAHERLYFQGQWQEGLVPQHGVPMLEKKQYEEFFGFASTFKEKKGRDGRYVFNIPLEHSSRDAEYLQLDKISMAEFMHSKGWTSQHLNWYVNYCSRDDYGLPHSKVSAWAGLHYFASRSGLGANADSQTVLTWPEGNGFLAHKLHEKVAEQIQSQSLVYSIRNHNNSSKGASGTSGGAYVDVLNTTDQSLTRYDADHVIYCGPRFTANRVIQNLPTHEQHQVDYAPWLVANISLSEKPTSTSGAPLSWDNVSYYSQSLGYINATHQNLTYNHRETVLTYYLPLDSDTPKKSRIKAYMTSYEEWLDVIVPDLEKMHPGITRYITHLDVWVWGHGMVSPGVDFIWSEQRQRMQKPFGRVHFAHSDMSGVSIFEEAQYRGVEAAKIILQKRGPASVA